jgi:hypothetical protein
MTSRWDVALPDLHLSDVLVFTVVTVVCIAQSIGFFSRPHNPAWNRGLGVLILCMAVPAAAAAVLTARSGGRWWLAPASFVAFAAFALIVDYIMGVPFRQPPQPAVLVPYLMLFYGSILAMGLYLLPVSRVLWAIAGGTAALLIVATIFAQVRGVG